MRTLRVLDFVVPLLLLGIVALGCTLRLHDPLSSPVVGAEDPYSHLVLTKEALARGFFGDSQVLGNAMYPPGIHALGGVLASDSHTDLYAWILFAPVGFGILSILGMFALGHRLSGPGAGLVAALLVAVMPEHIFRTELYFPTALDLAVLPAFLLSFVWATDAEGTRKERVGGMILFAVLAASLAFAHPWAVPLFLAPCAVWLALRTLRAHVSFREGVRRMSGGAILAVVGTSFAVASRWDHTDSGFASFFDHLGPLRILAKLPLTGPELAPVFLAVFALAAVPAVLVVAAVGCIRLPRPARAAIGIALGLAALAAVPYVAAHPQPEVNYDNMLGHVALEMGLIGLVLAFAVPTSVGDLGIAISGLLFPLTAINLFDSTFWPERTVVYLALGVALLGAGIVASAIKLALEWKPLAAPRRAAILVPAATIVAVLLVAGAVEAAPAPTYTWYRLYTPEEFSAIQATSGLLQQDPHAHILVESWQPGLFLKTFSDPKQVRYCPTCYHDAGTRSSTLAEHSGAWYAVLDSYADKDAKKGSISESWLEGAPLVAQGGQWRVYALEGSG